MRAGRYPWFPCAVALLGVLAGGCVSLDRAYPDRRFYAIQPKGAAAAATTEPTAVLRMEPLSVSRRYEQPELVYRLAENEYESDYYNALLIPPAPMLTEEVLRWMEHFGRFQQVIPPGSLAIPTHALEGSIVSMYGDYRDPEKPLAVLDMQFFLLLLDRGDERSGPRVILRRDYQERVAVGSTEAADLVSGFERALSRILSALATDVERTPLFDARAPSAGSHPSTSPATHESPTREKDE